MPVSSVEGLYRSDAYLALRVKVSLAAFRTAWQWVGQHPEGIYAATAAELADEADRCADLRDMRCEQFAVRHTVEGPDTRLVRRSRVPAGL